MAPPLARRSGGLLTTRVRRVNTIKGLLTACCQECLAIFSQHRKIRKARRATPPRLFPAAQIPSRENKTVTSLGHRILHAIHRWRVRRNAVRALHALDSRLLRDIGLERNLIESIVGERMKSAAPAQPMIAATGYGKADLLRPGMIHRDAA